MEFLKRIFKDDDKVIGLCSFRKKTQKVLWPKYSCHKN